MILYIENPKDTTKKLLELINEFGNVAGYKINIQNYIAFLYTRNELPEREIKPTIPFMIFHKVFIHNKGQICTSIPMKATMPCSNLLCLGSLRQLPST